MGNLTRDRWEKRVRDMNHHRPLTKTLDVLSVCLPLVLHVSFLVILCVPTVFGAVDTFWAIAPLGWNQVFGCFCLFFFSAIQTQRGLWYGPNWQPLGNEGGMDRRNLLKQRLPTIYKAQTKNTRTPLESTGPPEIPAAKNHFLKPRLVMPWFLQKLPAGTEVRIIGLPSIAAGRGGFQFRLVGKPVSINGRFWFGFGVLPWIRKPPCLGLFWQQKLGFDIFEPSSKSPLAPWAIILGIGISL